MHRSALIPSDESQLITTLAGGELEQISTDGWAVFIQSADRGWMLFPEVIAYEDDDPVRDVERIAIKPVALEEVASAREDIGRSLGRVESICVGRTLCAFLPGRPVGSTEHQLGKRKVEIPPGIRHDRVWIAPQRLAGMLLNTPELRYLHFMPLDVGLVLETGNHRILVRTHGFFAEPFLDPPPDSTHLLLRPVAAR